MELFLDPLGLAVVEVLLKSQLFTLYITPVVYYYMDRLLHKVPPRKTVVAESIAPSPRAVPAKGITMALSSNAKIMATNSEKYSRIFRFFPDAVSLTRVSDGTLLDVNEAFEHLTGYLREEIVGSRTSQLGCWLDPSQWGEVSRLLVGTGEVRDLDTRIQRRDGRLAYVLMTLLRLEIEGEQCYLAVVRDVSNQKHAEESGRERGEELRPKLGTLLSPDEDISGEDVRRIIDFQQIQELMNSFYEVTRIGIGLVDLKGNILVATGWQDICSKFHRLHPQTLANCIESDVYLSQGLEGENCKTYKCKNNMWDISTPIIVAGKHLANLFMGQFFFEDEVPDRETFTRQAEAYSFDKEEYLAALERIPRRSREMVRNVMEFYSHFARMVAELSYRNIRLAKSLVEHKRMEEALRESEEKFAKSFQATPSALTISTIVEGRYIEVNETFERVTGYMREEVIGRTALELNIWGIPEDRTRFLLELREKGKVRDLEARFRSKCGKSIVGLLSAEVIEIQGERLLLILFNDITERKLAEEALKVSEAEKCLILNSTIDLVVYHDTNHVYKYLQYITLCTQASDTRQTCRKPFHWQQGGTE